MQREYYVIIISKRRSNKNILKESKKTQMETHPVLMDWEVERFNTVGLLKEMEDKSGSVWPS